MIVLLASVAFLIAGLAWARQGHRLMRDATAVYVLAVIEHDEARELIANHRACLQEFSL